MYLKRTAPLLTTLFYCAISLAHFSNLIVFGDSLSDIGNFPESNQVWWNPASDKKLQNAIAQLYVPFSNPVNTQPKNIRYLSPQPPIGDNPTPRRYRSIGWTQFFLTQSFALKKTDSDVIAPSYLLQTQKIPANYSFNYAWGYATTGKGCVNPYYTENASCDAKSIIKTRKNYVENPSMQNYLQLQIPGLFEQVKLFLQDKHDHRVITDQNTVYTFWIGGNDLITASIALLKHYNPIPVFKFMLGVSGHHAVQSVIMLLQSLPKNEHPKTIYIINLFNPGLTPGFYNTGLAGLGNFLVKASNFWLKISVWSFDLFAHTKIVILPAYQWYQDNTTQFKNTMGQACQLSDERYNSPTDIPKDNCKQFMFWNAVHPAMPMQLIEAKQFLKYQSH